MSLTLRIFLAYVVIVVSAGVILFNFVMSELKPGVRQSSEDSLIDTANILAEVVAPEFNNEPDNLKAFSSFISQFLKRQYRAEISSVNKSRSNLRIYITDELGIVRYDSTGKDIGADYSRWNDVYLTLRGRYGARSTKSDPNDEFSTVMHVAAPIMKNKEIVGVLTVAKPNFSVQPFIDMAYKKIYQQGIFLVVLSLAVALTIAFLLTRSIRKLVIYADTVSHGNAAQIPKVYESELSKLASSIENMRLELEGKGYVEKYVHSLTHELKSPIAAIKGASELLSPQMPASDQKRFISNIANEINRMDTMINRMLSLASIEKQDSLEMMEQVNLTHLCESVIQSKEHQLAAKDLTVKVSNEKASLAVGDAFLLRQAVDNILQNAIDFAQPETQISIIVSGNDDTSIVIDNIGARVPDFAIVKVFERFYSLPRPNSSRKSTGLGLCFVKQIAELHHGSIQLENTSVGGVRATLFLKSQNIF